MLANVLPTKWSAFETSLFAFKLLGGITFIAYPGVLIASVMSLAAPVAKGDGPSLLWRAFLFTSLIYPFLFAGLWSLAERLKSQQPALALSLVALPVLGIYGYLAFEAFGDFQKKQQLRETNARLIAQITADLRERRYKEAFAIFNDPSSERQVYLLENSWNPGFDLPGLIRQEVPSSGITDELVSELLRYAGPSIDGATNLHRAHLDPKDTYKSTNSSAEVLQILLEWKRKNILAPKLAYHWQWLWENLELYQDRKEKKAVLAIAKENPWLAKLLEYQFVHEEPVFLEKIGGVDAKLINQQGAIFGTPLHALLLDNLIKGGSSSAKLIKFLRTHGAELAESEKNEVILGALERLGL